MEFYFLSIFLILSQIQQNEYDIDGFK